MTEGSRDLWEQAVRTGRKDAARRATWRRLPEPNPEARVRVFQEKETKDKDQGRRRGCQRSSMATMRGVGVDVAREVTRGGGGQRPHARKCPALATKRGNTSYKLNST